MSKIEIKKTELVWKGKYDDEGKLIPVEKPGPYPFQIIEVINQPRSGNEEMRSEPSLFEYYKGDEGDTFETGWRNKLIWGDNKFVMSSLLEKFAGKIDLIYIDPPFATGADFRMNIEIGEKGEEVFKEHSIIEEKSYRDTWGNGMESYLQMIYDRLIIMKELLSQSGSIYVHLDWHVNHYVKILLDEIFGEENFRSEIVWQRSLGHHLSSGMDVMTDHILWYSKNERLTYKQQYEKLTEEELNEKFPYVEKETGRRFMHRQLEQAQNVNSRGEVRIINGKKVKSDIGWRWSQETINERLRENPYLIYWTSNERPRYKIYADEYEGRKIGNLWNDIQPLASGSQERLNYNTQKPELLLDRIIQSSSNEGSLVADFFCGSGTTCAVAEKLNRRWIGVDLGRYAIHTTRKRLLEIANSKDLNDNSKKYGNPARPFEILNLGKYERQFWQVKAFNRKDEKQALYEYLAFILKLYGAEPIAGSSHIHGKKNNALIYVGAVDSPVTIQEVNDAMHDCKEMGQKELHILGWEWEMGLNDAIEDVAKQEGIKLKLRTIPMDVLDPEAVRKGDIRFFELAYFKVDIETDKKEVKIKLEDFVIPHTDLIPQEVKDSIKKWQDWVDYWAVDFDFKNDTFNNTWTSYRTRQDRKLNFTAKHTYEKPGTYKVLVKIIDIFGIDTSQLYEVKIK